MTSLAERLGYPGDAKLLVVHADDLGVAHSVNRASIGALEAGAVDSASIMVPCPWMPEIAAFARDHTDLDLGIHLTLTSEWKLFRWQGVLSSDRIGSLLDPEGYFFATCEEFAKRADPGEAEAELRAQVERARAFGIRPTHLDSHMGSVFYNADLFEAYLRAGRDFGLPVFAPRAILEIAPHLKERLRPEDAVMDHVVMASEGQSAETLHAFYAQALENLQPGVIYLIVHLAFDDAEMQAVAIDHPRHGSAWRQRDLEFFSDDESRRLIERHGVQRISWREIGARLRS